MVGDHSLSPTHHRMGTVRETWTALVGLRDLSPKITEALSRATNIALSDTTARARLQSAGMGSVTDSTPHPTRDFLAAELELFRGIVRRIGLLADSAATSTICRGAPPPRFRRRRRRVARSSLDLRKGKGCVYLPLQRPN